MSYGLYLSAGGAHAQSHRMQVLSNNIANVDTPGFKPAATVLQSRFSEMIDSGQTTPGLGGIDDLGGGVTINKNETQFQQGAIRKTERRTDFAITDANSFFVVQRGDEQLLTRAGNFLFDAGGKLVNTHGDAVLSDSGNEIRLDPQKQFQVGSQGDLRQAGSVSRLMLVRPRSLGDLSNTDQNHFRPLAETDVVPPQERSVMPGALEQSAVRPTAAMMELVETTRVYEANVKMIQNQDSVTGSLISRVLG